MERIAGAPRGIPLALFLLLKDYRFASSMRSFDFSPTCSWRRSSDTPACACGEAGAAGRPPRPLSGVFGAAGLCGLLIVFAYLRDGVQRLLTRAVFRGGRVEGAFRSFARRPSEYATKPSISGGPQLVLRRRSALPVLKFSVLRRANSVRSRRGKSWIIRPAQAMNLGWDGTPLGLGGSHRPHPRFIACAGRIIQLFPPRRLRTELARLRTENFKTGSADRRRNTR